MTSWDGGTLDEREYLIVRGTVQQIVYYNDENGYAVLRLAAENGAEVTATGTFPNIGLGEEVILTGCWVTHPTYGEQFATEAFERRLPTSVRGIAAVAVQRQFRRAVQPQQPRRDDLVHRVQHGVKSHRGKYRQNRLQKNRHERSLLLSAYARREYFVSI